jgi:hypothetical protein
MTGPIIRNAANAGLSKGAMLAALLAAGTAAADEDEKKAPYLEVKIPIEVENDWNFHSENRDNKHDQLYTTVEPEMTLGIWGGLSLYAHSVLEPVRDPRPRESRYFKHQGIYLQDVYLQYKAEVLKSEARTVSFAVKGGKFTPNFGVAWDVTPGVYGTDFAEDYEFAERWGFAGEITLAQGVLGDHTLSASTFFLDTTPLSGSLITGRGRIHLSDGGPSNTEDFSSFQVALKGEKIPGLEGLKYHLGYIHQAVKGGPAERGFAAALMHEFPAGPVTVAPMIEYAHFWDAGGVAGQHRDYLTTAVQAKYEQWNLAVAHTFRHAGGADGRVRDNLVQVSAGYEVAENLTVDVGWSFRNEDSVGTHTVGVLLKYEFGFTVGGKSK